MLTAGQWFWVIVTLAAAIFTIVLSFSPDLQKWFSRNGMDWITEPAFFTVFWLVWYCVGQDTLTTTLALIGTWYVNLIAISVGIIVLAFSTGFGAMLVNTVSYWITNAPKFGVWYFVLGLAGLIVALWLTFRRGKS